MKVYVYEHAFTMIPLISIIHNLSEHSTLKIRKLPINMYESYIKRYEEVEEYIPHVTDIEKVVKEMENYEADFIIVTRRFFIVISVE